MRRLAADLGGSAWSPNGGFIPQGFSVIAAVGTDVIIPEGSFYVDGILCEIEATPVAILDWGSLSGNSTTLTVGQWTVDDVSFAINQYLLLSDDSGSVGETAICQITGIDYAKMQLTVSGGNNLSALTMSKIGRARRLITYLNQPYWPNPTALAASTQLYIDVWERLITSYEDDSIREVALNCVDTAARTKVIWQIKSTPLAAGNVQTCMTAAEIRQLAEGWHRGVLRARVQPAAVSTDPCTISPTSLYQGAENQLYRVEIHQGGAIAGGPTFKWSRENGSVVFPGRRRRCHRQHDHYAGQSGPRRSFRPRRGRLGRTARRPDRADQHSCFAAASTVDRPGCLAGHVDRNTAGVVRQ